MQKPYRYVFETQDMVDQFKARWQKSNFATNDLVVDVAVNTDLANDGNVNVRVENEGDDNMEVENAGGDITERENEGAEILPVPDLDGRLTLRPNDEEADVLEDEDTDVDEKE